MEKNFVRSIVDSVVKELFEGGPGSGRYPKGSSGNSSEYNTDMSNDPFSDVE